MVVAPASVWSSHRNNNEDYSDTSLAPNTLYLVLQHPVPAPAPHVEPCHPVSLHVNTRGEAALVRPQLGDVVFPGLVTRDTAWCGPRDVMNDTRWCEHQPSPTTWQGWEDLLQCLHVALHLCWDQDCCWPTVTPPPPWPRLYTRLPHLTSLGCRSAGTRWPPASTTSGDLTSP